eukprot:8314245-Lingulodinium_polyedra.AAC.1
MAGIDESILCRQALQALGGEGGPVCPGGNGSGLRNARLNAHKGEEGSIGPGLPGHPGGRGRLDLLALMQPKDRPGGEGLPLPAKANHLVQSSGLCCQAKLPEAILYDLGLAKATKDLEGQL